MEDEAKELFDAMRAAQQKDVIASGRVPGMSSTEVDLEMVHNKKMKLMVERSKLDAIESELVETEDYLKFVNMCESTAFLEETVWRYNFSREDSYHELAYPGYSFIGNYSNLPTYFYMDTPKQKIPYKVKIRDEQCERTNTDKIRFKKMSDLILFCRKHHILIEKESIKRYVTICNNAIDLFQDMEDFNILKDG